MNDRRRVVITGIGVVSPNGIGRDAFTSACIEGRSGVRWLQDVDQAGLKSVVAAQVLDFDPAWVMEPAEARRVPRMIPMALLASRQALDQAAIHFAEDDIESQRKMGVALGTGG